jgi:hypothetical protein
MRRSRRWNNWLLPRWVVGSVRLHLDIEDLILAVLLFDGIVIPHRPTRPISTGGRRGDGSLKSRSFCRINLGDLVYEVSWNEELRSDFRRQFAQLTRIWRNRGPGVRPHPAGRSAEGVGRRLRPSPSRRTRSATTGSGGAGTRAARTARKRRRSQSPHRRSLRSNGRGIIPTRLPLGSIRSSLGAITRRRSRRCRC